MAVEVAIERPSSAGLALLLLAGSWSAVCCAPSHTPPATVPVATATSTAATSTAATSTAATSTAATSTAATSTAATSTAATSTAATSTAATSTAATSTAATSTAATSTALPAAPPPDDARGGRLYDNWRTERKLSESFTPDASKTPELDGKGGPNGNGTLNDGAGRALANTGHDYRLKNYFGWDLRGAEGVYGPPYQNKSYVLGRNLLTDTRSADEIQRWLAQGDEGVPAYGQVLDEKDLADLAAFVVKTRDAALARPDHVYRLEAGAPKNYVLLAGADPERGRERFAQTCAECHGTDGRKLPIDDTESVGTLSRASAYEIWFKIQHGHPGSPMKRQVSEPTGAENSRAVLDILAALCDRTAFPARAGAEAADVPSGDPRCGSYLR